MEFEFCEIEGKILNDCIDLIKVDTTIFLLTPVWVGV